MVALLTRELDGFKREIALFEDDASLWQTMPGITNPAGNLAVHVAGGLQYLIGAVLGDTGYVRNRDAEFSRRTGTRDEVIAELDRALVMVQAVLPRLSQAELAAEFPEPVLGVKFPTSRFVLHLCAHAAFHLGQAGYLRRAMTGDSTSSGPLPLGPLGR
ncbi:MAG: DinB family protein [Acidobacteriota bacterium]